ncbi:MAG: DNA glycosylase [Eubacteriales bacterium]|nr:DNA glycosylase [Eubacteriales bacterium]
MAKKIIFNNIEDFNPDQIFDCGQCFRWEKMSFGDVSRDSFIMSRGTRPQNSFRNRPQNSQEPQKSFWQGVVGRGIASVNYDESKGRLTVYDSMLETGGRTVFQARKFWRHYFDLDRDYGQIKKKLSRGDEVMQAAIKQGGGIRILNQDPWETLVSFIISQNNNIPRIKKCISSLSRILGNRVGFLADGTEAFSIPEAEVLAKASLADLAECRLGYRDKYLIEAAKQYIEWGKEEMRNRDLTDFAGVGPKVANCVSLFCLQRADSFPVDVWMRRVMHELYGLEENDMKGMSDFARKHFAPYGGIAQQYLFYFITHKGVDKQKQ